MARKPELRKTKIVATIGPACDSVETLKAMMRAGMNVTRVNLSHGTFAENEQRIHRIREAVSQIDANVAIMIDTKGAEIRTGRLDGGSAELVAGASFTLYIDGRIGNEQGVSVSYKLLPAEVTTKIPILLDDGAIELEVESLTEDAIRCRVVHGGFLLDTKSVNLPDTELSISAVGAETWEGLTKELSFAAENDVDYIAASFVQSADDVLRMRAFLHERNGDIPIIAKIESKAGVANLNEIVATANGTMVARGDLGVELPLAEVPTAQKKIIRTTVMNGRPVITATQMLATMEHNPKPTRAEASDVANAILDGTSAVMLSGETAVGRYPVTAVRTMATLALRAEASLGEYGYLQKILPHPSNVVTEAVSQAAVGMAAHLNAAAIFSLTETGFTSRLISKHRPACPILAITSSKRVARRLSMNWGVTPILFEKGRSDETTIEFAIERAMEFGYVHSGDILVSTAGYREQAGGTDLIRVITLG